MAAPGGAARAHWAAGLGRGGPGRRRGQRWRRSGRLRGGAGGGGGEEAGLERLRALAARRMAKGLGPGSESESSEGGEGEESDGSKEGWEELRAMASGPAGLDEEEREEEVSGEDDGGISGAAGEGGDGAAAGDAPGEPAGGDADAEKLMRTVFVGNVPVECKAKALKRHFSQHGTVVSVRLRSVPLEAGSKLSRKAAAMKGRVESGRSTHAYVVFESVDSAVKALSSNMESFEGKHLRVDRAAPPGEGQHGFDSARSVFIGNLDFDLEDEDLIKMIDEAHDVPQAAGHVKGVRLVRDKKNNMGKGFGFVLFDSKEAAKAALALDGRKVKGRALRVTRVQRSSADGRDVKSNAKRRINGKGGSGDGGSNSRKASWQGVQTKGKKGMRESKQRISAKRAQAGSRKGKSPEPKKAKASGKRPAVAKRKAAAMAAKAQGGGAQPHGAKKPKKK